MINAKYAEPGNHNLAASIRELGDEIKSFLRTRLELLKSELIENVKNSRRAALYGAIAVVLLLTAYLLLMFSLVALIAAAFATSPYAWFFGSLIVGVVWLMLGGVIAMVAKREFRPLTPTRTVTVLKQDKLWIEGEARNQL